MLINIDEKILDLATKEGHSKKQREMIINSLILAGLAVAVNEGKFADVNREDLHNLIFKHEEEMLKEIFKR